MGASGLSGKPHFVACLGERAALRRSLGWHSWLPPFLLRPSQVALGECVLCPLPSRLWLNGPPNQPDPSLQPDPQETHRLYRLKLEELTKLQNNCTSSITRQKKQLQELTLILKKLESPILPQPLSGVGCLTWWGVEGWC